MDRSSGWIGGAQRVALALCTAAALCAAPHSAAALPTLDELLAGLGFSKDDATRIRNGELVEASAKETSERELAVAMAFLVKAPVEKLLGTLKAGPSPSNDPQLQAVTAMTDAGAFADPRVVVLQPGGDKETQRYLDAAPGDTLNLSDAEIARFQALAGGAQDQVEDALRQMLAARQRAYRSQGFSGIAPYARGKGKASQPADDLRRAVQAAKGLQKYAAAFHQVLANYPQGATPALQQEFFCLRYAMSGRPTFALRHRMSMPVDDAYVVADRDYYVSSGYNDTQAVGALLPVQNGTVVFYLNGRHMMAKQITEIFE